MRSLSLYGSDAQARQSLQSPHSEHSTINVIKFSITLYAPSATKIPCRASGSVRASACVYRSVASLPSTLSCSLRAIHSLHHHLPPENKGSSLFLSEVLSRSPTSFMRHRLRRHTRDSSGTLCVLGRCALLLLVLSSDAYCRGDVPSLGRSLLKDRISICHAE